MSKKIKVYRAGIHIGEERIVHGNQASGMVTLSGCNLSCDFCYTPETSLENVGEEVSQKSFYSLLESLVTKGALNINLITPTHLWDAIEPVLVEFRRNYGERVPVVLKVGGFETTELAIRMAGQSDVIVPDFKVAFKESAQSHGLPGRYPETIRNALMIWLRTHGTPVYHSNGKIRHGLLVRHLLIPGFEEDAREVIQVLKEMGYHQTFNLMTYFIDPKKGRIRRAQAHTIRSLLQLAKASEMRVLLDGRSLSA